ncbi:MAG: hypothetical protein HOL11_08655, partial [Porticoccaceae bacterium]|nr:hypothetical protein [Porticoccaceae bacterium]
MNHFGANIAAQKRAKYRVTKALYFALSCLSSPLLSSEPANGELQITPPDNWYQVEVIIFTQRGDRGSETAPTDYQLEFPKNWRQLVDPDKLSLDSPFPVADGALLSEPDRFNIEERTIP